MRVLFLYTSTNMCRDGNLWYYDEATAVVVSCLRTVGHTVHFRTVDDRDTYEDIAGWVASHAGERTLLVFMTSLMFSAFGHDLPDTFERVSPLKKTFGFPMAFVGVHATLNPDRAIAYEGIDFIGRGEMEEALVEFCDTLEAGGRMKDIRNFWVKENGTVHRNPLRPLVERLDRLPFPARDLLPTARMANERDHILTVVASRGCPMTCNFCSNPVLRDLYQGKGKYFRLKRVEYLFAEIRAALEADKGIRAIFFQDDVFCLSPGWTRDFLARYPEEVGLPWGCNLLARQASPAFTTALRRSGCRQVQVGIESGSPHLRNVVLNKGISNREIQQVIDACRKADLFVTFYAMTGLPGETRSHLVESIRNLARYRPDMIQIQMWEALEGSGLQESDPATGKDSPVHGPPVRNRRAWRDRFFFRYFHRFVAIFEALESRRTDRPVMVGLAAALVSLAIRFPLTPGFLLARDWDGRRRFAALWMENRLLGRLAIRWGGRFWRDVKNRELRLASLFIWPPDLGPPPTGRGWIGPLRVDLREEQVCSVPEKNPTIA